MTHNEKKSLRTELEWECGDSCRSIAKVAFAGGI